MTTTVMRITRTNLRTTTTMSKRSEELRARLKQVAAQEDWESDEQKTLVDYRAANGHLMTYRESKAHPGQPAPACVFRAWHSPLCKCGGPLPD